MEIVREISDTLAIGRTSEGAHVIAYLMKDYGHRDYYSVEECEGDLRYLICATSARDALSRY